MRDANSMNVAINPLPPHFICVALIEALPLYSLLLL